FPRRFATAWRRIRPRRCCRHLAAGLNTRCCTPSVASPDLWPPQEVLVDEDRSLPLSQRARLWRQPRPLRGFECRRLPAPLRRRVAAGAHAADARESADPARVPRRGILAVPG